MENPILEADRQKLRAKLVDLIRTSNPGMNGQLTDNTSLIQSGRLDSLCLFNVATFVEREVGCKVDLTSFDLAKEWDTIGGILGFVQKRRESR